MRSTPVGVVFAFFLAAGAVSRAQDLSPAEKTLVRSIEARVGEQVAALETVVNIDSGTFNPAGVREVGRFFDKEFQALGFKTRWIPMPEAMHRGGHLVAERVSSKPKGRVFMTGDEENPGLPTSESRRDVVAAAKESDVALSFEPGQGKIVLGRRGLTTWSLDVTGAQGHSASVFHKGGAGAVYEVARILDGPLVAGADGLGVNGDGFHAPDERMDARTLVPATQRAAVLIGRLLHTAN